MNKNITLDEAIDFLRNIPAINAGGCAIAAFFLYNTALKDGLTVDIIYLYSRHCKNTTNLNFIKFGGVADSCAHVMLKDYENDLYIDSSGKNDRLNLTFKPNLELTHIVNINHLIHSIHQPKDWNITFQKDVYLPIIEKFFGYKLPTLEK